MNITAMTGPEQYRLDIDAWTPDTLPMARLAAYMGELAKLLGESSAVHFRGVEKGSAVLVAEVDATAAPKVRARMDHVRSNQGPTDAVKALKALDELLAADNAVAVLKGSHDNVVYVHFEGRNRPKPIRYGPFKERGSLEGVIIKVGGTDRSVPVWIQDGDVTHHCTASVEMSKRLAARYRDGTLRVHGTGKWSRETDGSWLLDEFVIDDFEVLEDTPLGDVVRQLRAVEGAAWRDVDDPLAAIMALRGEGSRH